MKVAEDLCLLSILAVSLCVGASYVKILTLRVPEGHDDIFYDASRVNVKDLKHWLTLSPVLSQNDNFLYPEIY
jgi:hypothetical protein